MWNSPFQAFATQTVNVALGKGPATLTMTAPGCLFADIMRGHVIPPLVIWVPMTAAALTAIDAVVFLALMNVVLTVPLAGKGMVIVIQMRSAWEI